MTVGHRSSRRCNAVYFSEPKPPERGLSSWTTFTLTVPLADATWSKACRRAPPQEKSETRAAMTAELLSAHDAGRVEVAIGRASDYFGPGTTQSALGETVFAMALTGRRAQVMGKPELPHSYSYTPDVAAALVTLGTSSGATGSVWHLPVAKAWSSRDIIDHVYGLADQRPRCIAAGATTLRSAGGRQAADA